MVSTLVLSVSIVLKYLTAGFVLPLVKITGNGLVWMFLTLPLSPVISTRLSRFSIVQLRFFTFGIVEYFTPRVKARFPVSR